jgi:DNA polymerase-1
VIILKSTDPFPADSMHQEWLYNGLDCCVTLEVFRAIRVQLDEVTGPVYEHVKSLQAPLLEMMLRGVRVDQDRRGAVEHLYRERLAQLEESLSEILTEGLGIDITMPKPVKGKPPSRYWNSPHKLKTLFYEILGLPTVRVKGQVTTDRKALEKLRGYFWAEPIVNHILAIRDCKKKLGVLKTGIDADGRIRTSFNGAGTDTGRLSSYASSFGSGTNLQNITGELRDIFSSDPGKKLAYIDLEQAEARDVGAIIWNIFGDSTYLDYCESGDLHTNVAKMVWPELGWTGDPKLDRAIADRPYYREFSYRDIAKRLGHGTNYRGKPPHMAAILRIPVHIIADFQDRYFKAFPYIKKWHEYVAKKLLKDGWLISMMGRRRWFMGRRWEDETIRAAIAYDPQGSVGDYMNRGLVRVWKSQHLYTLGVELLLQVHDAIVFQYPIENEAEVIPAVREILSYSVPLMNGRSFSIPTDAMVGWNWGYASEKNPDGLVKYKGADPRTRSAKALSILDRKF